MALAPTKAPPRKRASRDFPPLFIAAVASLALLAVMPSALNLPQTNPSQTLEYAPVPPEDEDVPPPAGNFSSLGLGSSASVGQAPAEAGPGPDGSGGGEVGGRAVKTPSTKRCVGNPPRQTEDESSPPCVASFTGDNAGATYQGVTREEVRILLYVDGNYNELGSRGIQGRPNGELFDIAEPLPEEDDKGIYWLQAAQIWQRYFNERFQTYGRFAHLFVSFGTGQTPEARKADAVNDYRRVKPFAVIVQDAPYQSSLPYVDVMAKKSVLAFGIRSQLTQKLMDNYAGKLWTYWPSLELQVNQYVDYVCTRVVPFNTSFAGNNGAPDARLHNGKPRRLGLLYVDRTFQQGKTDFAMLARDKIKACGGNFVSEGSFPSSGFICCSASNNQAATETMARFQSDGVTTIIWPQGYSPEQSQAAGRQGYLPEWVLAGDRQQEELVTTKYQDPNVWRHALVVTNVPLTGPLRTQICVQALREVEPEQPATDLAIPCRLYQDFRQVFIGIQVAGPKLTPASLEKGFRAIPNRPSGSPTIPACFYLPGDYTCVKDSIAQYWDPEARSTYNSSTGCYRIPQGGRRYLEGDWPRTDAAAERAPNDPCNGYTSGQTADPSPGPDAPIPQ